MIARIAAILLTVAFVGGARADVTLTLRTVARVAEGRPLTLGDVATITGDAGVASIRLPESILETAGPDGRTTVSIDTVRETLRAHRIEGGRVSIRGDACTVLIRRAQRREAASDTPTQAEQAEAVPGGTAIEDHVRFRIEQILGVEPNRLELGFEESDLALLHQPSAGRTVEVHATGFGSRTPIRLTLYAADGTIEEHRLRVEVRILRDVARAGRAMARGTALRRDDITITEAWLAPDDSFVEPVTAIGQKLRKGVDAGDLLNSGNVEPPIAVKRGDIVIVHVVSGTIVIRRESRALEAGRVGQSIELEPMHGGQSYRARIDGPGRAVIMATRTGIAGGTS